jgi:thiol-disulfide isomerase/thioredoxin
MKKLLFTLLYLLTLTQLQAQQITIKNGDEFAITIHTTEKGIKLPGDDTYTFQFKMLNRNAVECKLQCTLLKVKQWHKGYGPQINSDSIRNTGMNNSAVLIPFSILQKSFTVIVSPKGRVIRLEGIDELVTQAAQAWHLKVEIQQNQKANLEGFLLPALKRMFFELPEQKIAYQSTWVNNDTKANYKVTAAKGPLLDIAVTNPDVACEGIYTFNTVTGLLTNARSTYSLTQAGVSRQYNYSQSISYGKSTASSIDTAWVNMAVLFSYWSDAFNTKSMRVDSAKAFGYFKGHDALYKNDTYYNSNKLSLVQHLETANADMTYNNLLTKTPDRFLKNNPIHLSNKLQQMWSVNADSAFNLVRYLNNYPDFNDWLQLYARGFINGDDPVSKQLLTLLNADKSMGLQPQINALTIWVNAKSNVDKPEVLLNSYNSFMHMNDVYMKSGNGARCALLIYKMLSDAKQDKEADNLLLKTTENLERYAVDTLNKLRFADENILAFAYYLKYQSVNKTDSVKALQYLAKAAEHSTEKKYRATLSSLSDPLFLGSKKSYREEYIDKLFAHGDKETALKLFADHINADPSELQDMENIYQAKFLGRSFKDFFRGNVMNAWPDAPDFALTGLNGEKHSLADYKGKWLVLDFWGTWCAPCRKEMPKVNEFNNDLLQGKYAGVTLLGIACNDNAIAVKKYLNENKIGITMVMGDSKIPGNYHIKEYPSKILISPNGKMMEAPSGSDWQDVIKRMSDLYGAN